MRTSKMIVFLLVVLGVYGLANFYILRRGWQALAGYPSQRIVFLVVFGLLILAYPLGRVMNGTSRGVVSDVLIRFGSFYMALMLHLFLLLVVVDLFRLANAFLNFFPKGFAADPHKTGLIVFITVMGIGLGVVVGGYVNALHLRLRTIEIDIDKPAGAGFRTLNIAMASDIHLGTITGSRRLERIVGRLNALEPDIVLLPGDIVDESVSRAEEEKMISCLRSIQAPLGVFSVPGNHEVYGGLEKNLEYLRRGGVRVLQDEAVLVDGAFVLAGRKDPTVLQSKERRMPIREILEKTGADPKLPIILLDHQPVRLVEAVDAGIDLQLSGHTHAGQLFPLNLINKKIWEKYWGYLRKGKTQYYISCGVGTWGPPVRTGSIPEIVRIKVSFH
ncbi:metallophosphoesterase [bacterium]|nr:MAG: metallophosphoesterase [bacterium]